MAETHRHSWKIITELEEKLLGYPVVSVYAGCEFCDIKLWPNALEKILNTSIIYAYKEEEGNVATKDYFDFIEEGNE